MEPLCHSILHNGDVTKEGVCCNFTPVDQQTRWQANTSSRQIVYNNQTQHIAANGLWKQLAISWPFLWLYGWRSEHAAIQTVHCKPLTETRKEKKTLCGVVRCVHIARSNLGQDRILYLHIHVYQYYAHDIIQWGEQRCDKVIPESVKDAVRFISVACLETLSS